MPKKLRADGSLAALSSPATVVPGNSGADWSPPEPAERERNTVTVQALLTPSAAEAFRAWAVSRGQTPSAAIRSLIVDALVRFDRGEALDPLYSDLPPVMARRIVATLEGA